MACALATAGVAVPVQAASAAPVPDLETLTGLQAQRLMAQGKLTSVELTRAYLRRIEALNRRGPGLNAVTQLNREALRQAAELDRERARGRLRGPAHGLPVLLKDLIDVKGMYTSAGNYSLRNSFPANDSGVAEKLRQNGVVILGKVGLSEYANYFGSQPSGFGNLTGQVLNALDADQNPSGSSSGSGTASAAALSMLIVGTETSGSIISPSQASGIVGLRPTVGLVPGVGIAPISASQDTAGPMDRTVENAALTLQSIAGPDPESSYAGLWDPRPAGDPSVTPADPRIDDDAIIPPAPAAVPDYLSALDPEFVRGKRIGWNGDLAATPGLAEAKAALEAAGAILVERPVISAGTLPAGVLAYEAKRDINRYYANLGPLAPITSLTQELQVNQAESAQALKFGNATHAAAEAIDISPNSAASVTYRTNLRIGKQLTQSTIDRMLQNDTPADTSDDLIAILGSVGGYGPRAGYPQITVPMGYAETTRRAVNVSIHAGAYAERTLLGVAYVLEQGTKKRRPPSQLNPSMYRCAPTERPAPFAARGACNPTWARAIALAGRTSSLPFPLETESVTGLQARMTARTLTSETLTRAYLARIALTNAEGPAIQAVRSLNADAVSEARALDRERARRGPRGPLHGIPVLLDDSVDATGLPTTGGSIALQNNRPSRDAALVARLRAAGAIVLGKANIGELGGLFDANMPEGYSSLGGQVLLPSDADKTPAGSSAGSAAATAAGLAAMAVGMETSTDTAQLIAPAGVAGVVGLKPTVGLVSRTGVLPVARSQDSPGPITRTVADAAGALQVMAGADPSDPATAGAPPVPDYSAGLTPAALAGKRVGVVSSTVAAYTGAVASVQALGATTVTTTVATPAPNPASITTREFRRDLDAYLAGRRGTARSLQAIIDYNAANPVEGLKYQQGELLAAQAVDLSDAATAAAYAADRDTGRAANRAVIDGMLANGSPGDPSDDLEVVMVPSGSPLVGVADRAGYPVLTVPAAFGTGNQGRNPIGVTFVGGAFSEARLLAAGFAFEQATRVRVAPSVTNPSMWRCVPGSAFFTGELCNPGDRLNPAVLPTR
jgi:Asp-tRNA(Asn)/Glu-tRNA(Gln) amidotransferase A subunit family amidase